MESSTFHPRKQTDHYTCLCLASLLFTSLRAEKLIVETEPDVLPSIIKSCYPEARELIVNKGIVLVSLTVDTQGKVAEVEVLKSIDERLEPPIVRALQNWRFKPALKNGSACAATVRMPVRIDI